LVPHLVGVPPGPPQQPLHPVRVVVPHVLGHLPPVLPVHPPQQPADVGPGAAPQVRAAEARADPPHQHAEVRRPALHHVRARAAPGRRGGPGGAAATNGGRRKGTRSETSFGSRPLPPPLPREARRSPAPPRRAPAVRTYGTGHRPGGTPRGRQYVAARRTRRR